MISEKRVKELLKIYGEAWEEQDTDKILTIFTEDAIYHEDLLEDPFIGHDEIANYWDTKVCSEQSEISFNPLNYYICEDTVITEWESRFKSNVKNASLHLKGIAVLEIEDDLIKSLREYWHSELTPME